MSAQPQNSHASRFTISCVSVAGAPPSTGRNGRLFGYTCAGCSRARLSAPQKHSAAAQREGTQESEWAAVSVSGKGTLKLLVRAGSDP